MELLAFSVLRTRSVRMERCDLVECVQQCPATTVIANAFRRALGLPQRFVCEKPGRVVNADRFADLEWCMANYGSPLDGRLS